MCGCGILGKLRKNRGINYFMDGVLEESDNNSSKTNTKREEVTRGVEISN